MGIAFVLVQRVFRCGRCCTRIVRASWPNPAGGV